MKSKLLILTIVLMQPFLVFAGIEWQSKTVISTDGKESATVTMKCLAQNGNVREEVIEVKGSDNSGSKKGGVLPLQG
jgi:hypothetical protein